jgi:hypothetical protein
LEKSGRRMFMIVDIESAFPPPAAEGREGGATGAGAFAAGLGGSTVKRFWQWWHFTRKVVVGKRESSTLNAAPQCLQKMIIWKPHRNTQPPTARRDAAEVRLCAIPGPLGDFRYFTLHVKGCKS